MPAPLIIALGIAVMAPSILAAAGQFFPPIAEKAKHIAFNMFPNKLPAITELAMMYFRKAITLNEYYDKARQEGFDQAEADNYIAISYQMLAAYDYITLWRREKMSVQELDTSLYKLGMSIDDVKHIKTATEYFPNPQDLIRFAVREVYTPGIAQAFGIFNELPSKFVSEAKKIGIDSEQARNHWGAHWVLPSINMGFEMLHRRIVDEGTVSNLLKALDIMPFWRDLLIQLSYNPLTRVDVRRMYRTGTLDEQEVYDAFLDNGYSPENAERLLDFTMKFENEDRLGLSRAAIVKAYNNDIISDTELKSNLQTLGYSESTVDFWVSMAAFDKEMDSLKIVEKTLKAQYLAGHLTIAEVQSKLTKYDIPATYLQSIVTRIELSYNEKLAEASKADLVVWLKGGVVEADYFIIRMEQLGYAKLDIDLYIQAAGK